MERGGGLQCPQTLQLANSLCSFVYISLNSEFSQVNLFLLISNNAWVCISTHINSSIELYITSSSEFIPHLVHQILQGKETCSLIDHEQFSPKLKNRHKRLCWIVSSLFFKKMGFFPCKIEQPLKAMELQEKYEKHIGKLRYLLTRLNDLLTSLKQLLTTDNPLKMRNNVFYVMLKALSVLELFTFLS